MTITTGEDPYDGTGGGMDLGTNDGMEFLILWGKIWNSHQKLREAPGGVYGGVEGQDLGSKQACRVEDECFFSLGMSKCSSDVCKQGSDISSTYLCTTCMM